MVQIFKQLLTSFFVFRFPMLLMIKKKNMLFKKCFDFLFLNLKQVSNIVSENTLAKQNRIHVLILALDTFGTRKTTNDR